MLIPATTVPVTIIGAFAAMCGARLLGQPLDLFAIMLRSASSSTTPSSWSRAPRTHRARHDGHDAAIQAMNELLGPDHRHHAGADVGVPAGRLPAGPDRPDVRAVRAGDRGDGAVERDQRADAKPTQCALWLRPPVPPEQRNAFYRGFNSVYARLETRLCRPDRTHGDAQRPDGGHRRWPSSRLAA